MNHLEQRIAKLESRLTPFKAEIWHRVIVEVGETQEQAMTRLGINPAPDENTMFIILVAPSTGASIERDH